MKKGTMIKKCSCVHAYQDKVYGLGKRVHNITGGKTETTSYTCTVCGRNNF